MSLRLTKESFSNSFEKLKEMYTIYAPKRFAKQGRFCDTDIVRYDVVESVDEIVYDKKSDYAAKEVISPITETLFYFTDDEYRAKKGIKKPILMFVRACDINAIKRQDDIYLKNGGYVDSFYKQVRDNIKFALMGCPSMGWDTCFCASMGGNIVTEEEYSFGIQFDEEVKVDIKDDILKDAFIGEEIDFNVAMVQENVRKVKVPEIPNKDIQAKVKALDLWKEYDKRCVKCGSCTIACSTCTCYTSYDMQYTPDSNAGERRRINASCHIDGYTDMAGGHSFRPTAGERMRFKTMHKVHDHKKRFGHNMCVGCGRCDDRCPAFISFSTLINKLTEETKKIVGGNE